MDIIDFFKKKGYPVCEKIGEGGFGEVYRLQDTDRINVAVKVVRAKTIMAKYLAREAKLSECLDHPAFPKYYGYYENEFYHYLLMEYIEGENLEKILKSADRFESSDIRSYGVAMAEALAYLHRQGYVFRDLKPANLILDQNGNLRIVDLGCVLHETEKERSMVGSPPFAAPEQLEKGVCHPACDIYSWGMIMQFLIQRIKEGTEEKNIDKNISKNIGKNIGKNTGESGRRWYRILKQKRDSKEIVEWKKLIQSCLEKEPMKRFPDAEQLALILKNGYKEPGYVICQNIWKNTCRF